MFIKGDLLIGFSLICFGLGDRKLHSYLCFLDWKRRKQKYLFNGKILSDWLVLFFYFSCPPWKAKPTEYSWNRVARTGESKTNQRYVNIQGYDVWRSCNVITTFFLWLSNQLLINSLIYIRIALCFSQALLSSAHWCIFNNCCLLKIWPIFFI